MSRPLVLLAACLFPVAAIADATVPPGVTPRARAAGWPERCAARLEHARDDLAARQPGYLSAKVTSSAAEGERRSIHLTALIDGHPTQAAIEWDGKRPAGEHANPPSSDGSWSIQRSARSHPAAPVLMERTTRVEGIQVLARVEALESERRFLQVVPSAIDECLSWARAASTPTSAPLRFAGHYRISGVLDSDGCGGRVHLAAQHIDISVDEKLLTADVVDRRYAAHLDGNRLVAALVGQPQSSAPDSRTPLAESWTFQHASDGRLEGSLSGKWQLQGASSPCEIRHRITASVELIDPTL